MEKYTSLLHGLRGLPSTPVIARVITVFEDCLKELPSEADEESISTSLSIRLRQTLTPLEFVEVQVYLVTLQDNIDTFEKDLEESLMNVQ
jgi:hypothetical protein